MKLVLPTVFLALKSENVMLVRKDGMPTPTDNVLLAEPTVLVVTPMEDVKLALTPTITIWMMMVLVKNTDGIINGGGGC